MTFEDDTALGPFPVPFKTLAGLYGVTPAALRKLGKKLNLRACFLENPHAVRAFMITDKCSRGKLRKRLMDENECNRISENIRKIQYAN